MNTLAALSIGAALLVSQTPAGDWRPLAGHGASMIAMSASWYPPRTGWRSVEMLLVYRETNDEGVDYEQARMELNCDRRESRIIFIRKFRITGEEIGRTPRLQDAWRPVPPGSGHAIVLDTACGLRSLPDETYPSPRALAAGVRADWSG